LTHTQFLTHQVIPKPLSVPLLTHRHILTKLCRLSPINLHPSQLILHTQDPYPPICQPQANTYAHSHRQSVKHLHIVLTNLPTPGKHLRTFPPPICKALTHCAHQSANPRQTLTHIPTANLPRVTHTLFQPQHCQLVIPAPATFLHLKQRSPRSMTQTTTFSLYKSNSSTLFSPISHYLKRINKQPILTPHPQTYSNFPPTNR
jgi:hypothetical protein